MSVVPPDSPNATAERPRSGLTWFALLVALVAVAGSLWLSLGMNLKACPLCFYQRTFAMAVLGVLVMGLLTGARHSGYVSLLALPLASGGLAVAGWHVYLEATGKLECPKGIADLGTAPQQSLAALAILFVVLLVDAVRNGRSRRFVGPALLTAVLLGAAFGYAGIKSVPLPPRTPKDAPLDGCRPPYRAE